MAKDYHIRFHGRAGLTYTDQRGEVEVDGEVLVGDRSYAIYPDRMKLVRTGTSIVIDEPWRAEIVSRIGEAVGGRDRLEVYPEDCFSAAKSP
jgi:hypothetical protein